MWQEGHIATAHGRFNHTCQYDNVYRQKIPTFYNRPLLSPSKLPLHMGDLDPSNTCFFGPTPLSIPNGISISSAIFAPFMAESPYILQRTTPSPLKIAPLHGASGPSSNIWFLGSTEVQNPNGILIGSAILQDSQLWQTDRLHHSIWNNRLLDVCSTAMQPNNK